MFQKPIIIYTVTILILASIIVFLGVGWMNTMVELKKQSQLAKVQQINLKAVDFFKLFIANVLKNQKEVTFEERLQLENAILDLKDQQLLDHWHKFTSSKTESEAQQATVELFELLVNKIK